MINNNDIKQLREELLKNLEQNNFFKAFELYCNIFDNLENKKYTDSIEQKNFIRFLLKVMRKAEVLCDDNIYNKLNSTLQIEDIKTQNILLNEHEIYNKNIELKSKPQSLQVTLTTLCNANCRMCGNKRMPKWEVSDFGVENIVSLLPYVQEVTWMGGEVFTHNKFNYLVEKSSFYETEQSIITNGTFYKDDIVKILTNNNVRTTVSLHSLNKSTYEYIMRIDALYNVYKFLDNLNKYRTKYFCLSLNFVVMKSNYKELINLIDFVKKYNIIEVILLPLQEEVMEFYNTENIFFGDNIDFDIIKNIRNITEDLSKEFKKLGVRFINNLPVFEYQKESDDIISKENDKKELIPVSTLNHNNENPKEKYKVCQYPWTKLFIENNGNIMISASCRSVIKEPMGHIDKDSLISVWNNEKIKSIRYKIVTDHCSEYCQKILD
ncbi:MAG: radical SAM protein [Elusimicrobia bacterium]|nr:radical SAM protein [Elusimicrobiota bacterium]